MSYAELSDTSSWAAFRSKHRPPVRGRYFRNLDSHHSAFIEGTGDLPRSTARSAPGTALGLITPSELKAESQRVRAFEEAIASGLRVAMDVAEADEADPPAAEIWAAAVKQLLPSAPILPPMLVNPLQLGGVSFEWHEYGLNIELRFRGVSDLFVVIEDARQELPEFYGLDPEFRRAREALLNLARRQG